MKIAFEEIGIRVAISDIQPLKLVSAALRRTPKYLQIATSIREVGIIEPPVIARDRESPGKYLLLDGHLRVEILKEIGAAEVGCLISTDDEGYTYNKRVNRLAIIQEHRMILKAIERGASDARIAKALNIDVKTLQVKKQLLAGICPEAVELLKDKHVTVKAFAALKKMIPLRQIEAADLMIAMNKYTVSYADSLLAATPQSQLVDPGKPKAPKGLSNEQLALMEHESVNLEREFKIAEQSYGTDHLDLVLAKGYVNRLLGNARVVRYLAQHQQELLSEFQKITESDNAVG
ncbi:MAG TPA: plasmid partitioning protein RepB C-terminal domain-containing protein [Pirellulales bacterium]